MHSKFILSPIQTFSQPPLSVWAFLGTDRVSVHLSNPDIEDGKRFKDPFLGVGTRHKQGAPGYLMLRMLVGVVRGECLSSCSWGGQ